MPTRFRSLSVSVVLCIFFLSAQVATCQTLSFELGKSKVSGKPVVWDAKKLVLLQPDGSIGYYEFDDLKNPQKISRRVTTYSKSKLQSQLTKEFGRGYQVTTTSNYVVVHPVGERQKWATKFEKIKSAVTSHSHRTGINSHTLQFPLVAIVLPNRAMFDAYIRKSGDKVPGYAIAYYSPTTNRVAMYDLSSRSKSSKMSQETWETVVHETAHQAAYNIGVHNRFTVTPIWVAEGFATMFEAKGLYDSLKYSKRSDRINRTLLSIYNAKLKNKKGWIEELITSDRSFQKSTETAYAGSWALTFYLNETQPALYSSYLRSLAKQKPYSEYNSKQRLNDFQRHFGNPQLLHSKMIRFYNKL